MDKIEGESSHDPYAYLNRREFTSENFKIELKNLPKYFGVTVRNTKLLFWKTYYSMIIICTSTATEKVSQEDGS